MITLIPIKANAGAIGLAIRAKVSDADVYELSLTQDCSMMAARGDLEAEAFADITGLSLDYHADWMERLTCLT